MLEKTQATAIHSLDKVESLMLRVSRSQSLLPFLISSLTALLGLPRLEHPRPNGGTISVICSNGNCVLCVLPSRRRMTRWSYLCVVVHFASWNTRKPPDPPTNETAGSWGGGGVTFEEDRVSFFVSCS